MDHLTEQDAGLLEQAASMLESLANDERNRGNCSSSEGAACSAHAIRRLAPALLRAGRGCLTQIEEPAQPAAPVLNDRWKARMLDGRAIERDEMGLGDHPELPQLDEGMKPRGFFAALGLELTHTMAEDQLDWEVLGVMSEAVNWTDWQPAAPQGDGWKLVAIFDTEEGPAAWWLRELAEAEDGTTTIRNLQAEIEKLKARMARVSRAGAAPAAVAPQGERQFICPTRTVADLVNNLLLIDQALPIYGAQYIDIEGRRCAIAVPPTVSRERVKDGRWIGQGEELNAAVVWTRAEQPAAVAGPASDFVKTTLTTPDSCANYLLAVSIEPADKHRVYAAVWDVVRAVQQMVLDGLAAAPALEAPAAPIQHQGMTIAGNGAAELGKLMREQRDSRLGVYPDGNPNSGQP